MSDYSVSEDEDQSQLTSVLQRYASTKGKGAPAAAKADKRTETSKLNMAKARAAKLAGLQKKKQTKAYEIEESDDESEDEDSSDEEDLIITKRKPQKGGNGGAPAAPSDRLSKIEEALMLLAQKGKKKPQKRKTVINVSAPQAVVAPANQRSQALKNNILNF